MAFTKLNRHKLQLEMNRLDLRPIDLAKRLGISRQLMNYILYNGGVKYVPQLSVIFDCDEEDLTFITVRTPSNREVVNNKVRKVKP